VINRCCWSFEAALRAAPKADASFSSSAERLGLAQMSFSALDSACAQSKLAACAATIARLVDLHGILTQDLHRKLTHPKRLLGVVLCGLFGGAFLLLGLGGAVLETIAIVAGFNNVAVVRQAVQ